jgi:predicted Zn-dependent protease
VHTTIVDHTTEADITIAAEEDTITATEEDTISSNIVEVDMGTEKALRDSCSLSLEYRLAAALV